MKVTLKNIGVFRKAGYELGEFTIICGKNNTGKTYATYSLFGFIDFWQNGFRINIPESYVTDLFEKGIKNIDLSDFLNDYRKIIKTACEEYKQFLPYIFATNESRFSNSEFLVEVNKNSIKINNKNNYNRTLNFNKNDILQISKGVDSSILSISFPRESNEVQNSATVAIIQNEISNAIKYLVFNGTFPAVFLASAERTGISMFEEDIKGSLHKNNIKRVTHSPSLEIQNTINEFYSSPYPLPVARNISFISQLQEITKTNSFIFVEHSEILKDFEDILGGDYKVDRDALWFKPKNAKGLKLSMGESSSSVRSLLDVGFYLKHLAQEGDLLMIDEPELNLHPENQRKLARLLARLVNIGIKVFVTTHSDYLIKELNTLIMLNHKKENEAIKTIMNNKNYYNSELISYDKIKVYIACDCPTMIEGNSRKVNVPGLKPAEIDLFYGIEADSFDKTIDEMNKLQQDIIFEG